MNINQIEELLLKNENNFSYIKDTEGNLLWICCKKNKDEEYSIVELNTNGDYLIKDTIFNDTKQFIPLYDIDHIILITDTIEKKSTNNNLINENIENERISFEKYFNSLYKEKIKNEDWMSECQCYIHDGIQERFKFWLARSKL